MQPMPNLRRGPISVINDLLQEAYMRGASDLHLTSGLPPVLRINGTLVHTRQELLCAKDTEKLLQEICSEAQRDELDYTGEIDFAYAIPELCRFRVNAFRQRGAVALAIRVIANKIPTLEGLGVPAVIKDFARKSRGLVLVTGPTGSGKSTTLAAMLDLINNERSAHIITLEDPIEYWHKHKLSIVQQREVNADTQSFANALRAALRQDPDVIFVGEMRDLETISTAITAAETGHLVLATLHTGDAVQTIDRIIDVFPPYQQQQIRVQLSFTLQGIIAQQLLPRSDSSGRVAAIEILSVNHAIRNLIREGKTHQIGAVMQIGTQWGMQSMDMSLRELYKHGVVTYEEARARSVDQETFLQLINGF